ncbi:MAG: hypothetical protein FIA99_03560 [Ruminiclostridium sp.]|nr:hypothetical protein [Ruminiclostridium sp.]
MKHVNKERIKSIVLIILFVISLIQVGILWTKQSHRLPISFLSGIFSTPQITVSDEITRNELFVPYRLILSSGEYSHWILDRNNPLYKQFWEEVKFYLAAILKGDLSPLAGVTESWGDITSKRGFVFEFKTEIRPDLLKWFLGNPESTVEIPAVYKIMIIPDSTNDSLNTIYIYDINNNTNKKVYKYQSWGDSGGKSLTEILSEFEVQNQDTYRSHYTIHDSNIEKRWDIEPDILYVSTLPAFWPYSLVTSSIPSSVRNENELAEVMLSNQKERYQKNTYNDGTIQFSINENLYKFYPDGSMIFENSSEVDSSVREDVGAALLNAYGFIKKAASLTNTKADIYLSGLDQLQNNTYRFSFDYMINGYPIYIDLTTGSGAKATNAVTIDANSKRVLKCQYIIRDFTSAGKKSYNDRLMDVMAGSDIKYKQIKNMGVGYVMNSVEDKLLPPYMVLENKETGLITKKLPEQKGD